MHSGMINNWTKIEPVAVLKTTTFSIEATFNLNTKMNNIGMDVRICTEWRLYNIITSHFGLYTCWLHRYHATHSMPHLVDSLLFRLITTISSLSLFFFLFIGFRIYVYINNAQWFASRAPGYSYYVSQTQFCIVVAFNSLNCTHLANDNINIRTFDAMKHKWYK